MSNRIKIKDEHNLRYNLTIWSENDIGNAKITKKLQFQRAAPVMKYHQKTYNSCCLSSLASFSYVMSPEIGDIT